VQWLALTLALAAVVVRSSAATSGLIDPHLDGSWVIIVAFLTALLLGITVESPKVLALLVTLMLLGAVAALAALVMLPVWEGVVADSPGIRNYAINQLVVVPLLMAIPAGFGALCGNLLRRLLGAHGELLAPDRDEVTSPAWWDRQQS
jgi:hypothetical protein